MIRFKSANRAESIAPYTTGVPTVLVKAATFVFGVVPVPRLPYQIPEVVIPYSWLYQLLEVELSS